MFRDVAEARCSSSQVFRYLVIFVARKKFCKVHFAVPRSFGIVFVFWGRNEHSEVAMRFAFGGGSGVDWGWFVGGWGVVRGHGSVVRGVVRWFGGSGVVRGWLGGGSGVTRG